MNVFNMSGVDDWIKSKMDLLGISPEKISEFIFPLITLAMTENLFANGWLSFTRIV